MAARLKRFSLPGKDSRCIRFDGRVFKIKTFMTPPTTGNIGDYVSEDVLQREIEDVFRAVLSVPPTVEPTIMKTKHFVIKPERKEWKLPLKVDFKVNGQSLLAHHFMYVLHVRIIEQGNSVEASSMDAMQIDGSRSCDDTGDPKPRKTNPSPSTSKSSKRQKRQLCHGGSKGVTPHLRSSCHKNTRLTPHRGASVTRSQYILRKRALRLPTTSEINSDSFAGCGKPEDELDGNNSKGKRLDEEKNGMGDEIIKQCQEREESPELESGYGCHMHAKAVLGSETHQWRKSGRPCSDQSGTSSIGDQGPLAAKPSDDGAARVAHIFHPGRERVEQHILAERLRLQEMATAAGDAQPPERQVTHGFVRQMIQAVVSPVKILFTGKK
ncbi:uncharacterized protein [Diadema setosum]|uniref:uncharacterized protein isoform X2 n=1 Tax=Diadema setosum TaxID=31175 RepID=UPI003B3BE8CD